MGNQNNMTDDFEEWEAIYEFYEKKDWEGFVIWAKRKYDKNPNGHYDQYYYGEALILNEEFEKAIDVLYAAHKLYPASQGVSNQLLEVLFKTNKTEKDIKWIEEPCILYLNDETINYCYSYLKNKKKNRTIADIHGELLMYGCFLKFSEEELCEFLTGCGKFDVIGGTGGSYYEIELKNKRNTHNKL
jgi:tetratricopeptide (TPR) repeat protein